MIPNLNENPDLFFWIGDGNFIDASEQEFEDLQKGIFPHGDPDFDHEGLDDDAVNNFFEPRDGEYHA